MKSQDIITYSGNQYTSTVQNCEDATMECFIFYFKRFDFPGELETHIITREPGGRL